MTAVAAVVVVLGVAVVAGVYVEGRARLSHGWHRLLWRWHTGAAWHGRAVPEDVWMWPGPWFWRLTRPRRAAVRCAVTLAVFADVVYWVRFPHDALLLNVGLAGLIGTLAAAAVTWAVVTWRHRRRWVRPLHRKIAPLAGIPLSGPMRYITLPRDRSRVVVKLPQHFAADVKGRAELVRTIAESVGLESPDPEWRLGGPAVQVTLTTSKPPPELVRLADVRADIERARADEVVWGLGKRSRVVRTSLSDDSPHIGLSMGSGAGKSVCIRCLLAQFLFHGAIALIIDFKRLSQHWAHDLPNVSIVRRPAEIHAALMWLGWEIERRMDVALASADLEGNVHATVGPRLIVAAEELNATMKVLRMYWQQVRDGDRSLPARSPALNSFDLVNLMGRGLLMNALYVGQRLSAKAGGGDGDVRESIGVMALGRYKASTWKMLAEDHAMPPKSLKPGRFQIVGDDVAEVQGIKISAVEARELALAGVVSPLPAGMPGARVRPATGVAISQPEQPFVSETTAHPGRVTLKQAVADGVVRRSLTAVQRASTRSGFPASRGYEGTAKLYDAAELADWDRP